MYILKVPYHLYSFEENSVINIYIITLQRFSDVLLYQGIYKTETRFLIYKPLSQNLVNLNLS